MRVNGSPSALPPPSAPRVDAGDAWSPVFGDLLGAPRIAPPAQHEAHPDPDSAGGDTAAMPAPLPPAADEAPPSAPRAPNPAAGDVGTPPAPAAPPSPKEPAGLQDASSVPALPAGSTAAVPTAHAEHPGPVPEAAPRAMPEPALPSTQSSRAEPAPQPAAGMESASPEPSDLAHREGASLLFLQRLLPQGGLSQLIRDADISAPAAGLPAAQRPAVGTTNGVGAQPAAALNRPFHFHTTPSSGIVDAADMAAPGEADPLAGEGGAEAVQVARRLLVALPWAPKLLRLAVEGDGTVSVWIRDYSLDPSMVKQLVQSVLRAAANGETPSLQRILVNGQLAWSSQQGVS